MDCDIVTHRERAAALSVIYSERNNFDLGLFGSMILYGKSSSRVATATAW